ncbi:DUF305 domain-containing protein [Rhodoglobus aureus]|uniref:DUF305 domain-containing protein n=1 Tax=Rhodoglobus aureus TaxID=191497 RepID=A0ABP4G564_9MICO
MRTAIRRTEAVTNPARRNFLAFGMLAVTGTALAACGAPAANETDSLETPNETDIGFFTDMALHHAQALALCQRVLGRDNGDSVQSLATEILQNQSYERGVMYTWLTVWGESTAPPKTVMAWIGMEIPAAEMTGLATDEQVILLSTTTGMAQGRLFLSLMRAHHVGGMHMAASARENAATSVVRSTADLMSSFQNYEIGIIDQLLATTYL